VATGPAPAFAATKQLINQAAGIDRIDFHLDLELGALARIANSPDFAEGLAAFFEKRPPVFGTPPPDAEPQ
jgi:enoyl-CoA hydratase/carnithine racemase